MQLAKYNKTKSTLSVVSKDDDGKSVIDSSQEVYNFDEITEIVADYYRVKKPLCSCDALYIKDDEHIFLIEFKNVRSSRVPKKSLKLKAYDSIFTLQFAVFPEYSLEELKEKVILVFVYNNGLEEELKREGFEKFKSKLFELSKENRNILFDLEIYKDVIYKDVFTVDRSEFINETYQMIFG